MDRACPYGPFGGFPPWVLRRTSDSAGLFMLHHLADFDSDSLRQFELQCSVRRRTLFDVRAGPSVADVGRALLLLQLLPLVWLGTARAVAHILCSKRRFSHILLQSARACSEPADSVGLIATRYFSGVSSVRWSWLALRCLAACFALCHSLKHAAQPRCIEATPPAFHLRVWSLIEKLFPLQP